MALPRAIAPTFALQAALVFVVAGCRKGESDAPVTTEPAAPSISAEEVLEKMLAVYETADTYSDKAQYLRQTVRRDEGIQRNTVIFELSLKLQRPNKVRFTSQREYPPSERDESFDIASDGALVRTASGELPEQIHETIAPRAITPENLVPEPNVREAVLNVSMENLHPQVKMIFATEDEQAVFPADYNPRVLDQQRLRDVNCYRVALDNPAGKRILWIDAERFMLLRMELPLEAQLEGFDPYGEFSRYAVLIDYIDPRLGKPLEPADFVLEVPRGARRVRRFVPPAPPAPPAEWGRPVAEFAFATLEGERIIPATLAGKVTLLEFWSQTCPPCKEHTPLLEQLYQNLKDEDDFAFYAVNMDPSSLTNVAAKRMLESWGGTISVLRDPDDTGYEKLGVRYFPHTILIGADGRVQYTFSGMHERIEPLEEKVRKLLAGDDLAAEARSRHQRLVARAAADLKAAELVGSLLGSVATPPQIPARNLPEQFQLTPLWQSSSETLQQPGDVQIVGSRLLVLDAGKAVVELDATGKQVARHDLPVHQETANGFLRVATSDTGRPVYVVSGVGWQQVYVLDDQWQSIVNFPDEKHAGVGDVLCADLAGAGVPLMYVGYQGGDGIQGVTLDGRKVWINHRLDQVLQIVPGPAADDGKRQAWCTSSRGTITRLAVNGQFAGEFSVVGQTIVQVGPVPADDDQLSGYCGLASSGDGEHAAVGFDAAGEFAWRYELPRGDYLHHVSAIHIAQLPSGESCWLVVAADGSLHWLDSGGELVDRCDYGAAITGIAVSADGDAPLIYVATDSELAAWQLNENPPEPTTDPPIETPTEEQQ